MVAFLVILVPFLQLGVSYYVSVTAFFALAEVVIWFRGLLGQILKLPFCVVIAGLMLLVTMMNPSDQFVGDTFRATRESLIFLFMCAAATWKPQQLLVKNPRLVLNLIQYVVIGLLGLCVAQAFFYGRGVYFGIPFHFFSTDATSTLPSELNLEYGSPRPSGTFREPSYLGFIILCFAAMINPLLGYTRKATIIMGVIVAIGLLSRSLAFLLAFFLVVLLPRMLVIRDRRQIMLIVGVFVALVVFAAGGLFNFLFERFAGGVSASGDSSTFARIVLPFTILPEFIIDHPFGVPWSELADTLDLYVPYTSSGFEIMQNGIFNTIFNYGIIGVCVIVALLACGRTLSERFFLFACGNFNGALFAQDKLAMLLLTFVILRSMEALVAAHLARARGQRKPVARAASAPRPGRPSGRVS